MGHPILHCKIGIVNDQLYKKIFHQILSLDVGTNDELKKRTSVLDLKEFLQQLHEMKSHMDIDLLMMTYQLSDSHDDLV